MVVFSILGYMAHVTNQDVSEIVAPGSGLAFIVYPEVVSRYCIIRGTRFDIVDNFTFFLPFIRIPGGQIWAALFFLMLISLALGSIFGKVKTKIMKLLNNSCFS